MQKISTALHTVVVSEAKQKLVPKFLQLAILVCISTETEFKF